MSTPIPGNIARFSGPEIQAATGAVLSRPGEFEVVGVTSDSRRVEPGNLFVALSGEHFDGHAFVEQALEAGASALLVERPVAAPAGIRVCQVDSTLAALGELGRWHRRRFQTTLIAVAGSAGKTTTKSALAAGLELLAPGRVHKSPGNLNNLIGVPFVLLGLDARHRFAVVEIGTNQLGEVERLTQLVEPNIGLLTVIGLEHSEGLGDLDSIEREEGALPRGLGPDGALVYNGDDERVVRQALSAAPKTRIGYGRAERADYRLLERGMIDLTRSSLVLGRPDGSRVTLEISLPGEAGAQAALATLATAVLCAGASVDGARLSACLLELGASAPGRLTLKELLDGSVVVDDSYNSNPLSVRSSLQVAREIAEQRRGRLVLVLGEMRELGALSAEEHTRLGGELAGTGASHVIAIAGDARLMVAPARARGLSAEFATDSEAALGLLLALAEPGDVVLVKASRGVRAERVVQGFCEAKGKAA